MVLPGKDWVFIEKLEKAPDAIPVVIQHEIGDIYLYVALH
jgi:hypothetical protein